MTLSAITTSPNHTADQVVSAILTLGHINWFWCQLLASQLYDCNWCHLSHQYVHGAKWSSLTPCGLLRWYMVSLNFQWFRLWLAACSVPSHNTLRPRQNGRHFPDDIFKCIFLNENGRVSIKFSLKFAPKVPFTNIPALVQIMAWRCPGDKPLSEPMTVSLLTNICVTRPQWVELNWIKTGLSTRLSETNLCNT